PNEDTWRTLNELFRLHPEIGMRVLWYDENDFSSFSKIPNIRSITIASFLSKDFTPFGQNKNLKHFGIEETKSTATDISFIENFHQLESLYVDGMKKGIESIQNLRTLNKLTLRGIKKENLDFLAELSSLSELNLLFGSYKNLESLTKIQSLKSIEFSRVRQIPNFDFLNALTNLEILEFEGMSKLEGIPRLDKLKNLKRLHVHNNVRMRDLQEVSSIPNLKVFQISFAENSKASERKHLIEQAVEIVLNSSSIEYTNIMLWTDENITKQLEDKGVKQNVSK
ncbi:MAG: hypothetical protein AAFQ94_31115, partial [Bacteroidota bacterium]